MFNVEYSTIKKVPTLWSASYSETGHYCLSKKIYYDLLLFIVLIF